MKKNRSVKNDAGNQFKLEVECDFTGLNEDQIRSYAFDSLWIKEQSRLRALSNKALEDLKGRYSFKAVPKGTKVARTRPLTTEELINELSGKPLEERLAIIEQIKALNK